MDEKFLGRSGIADDYVRNFDAVREFYAHDYHAEDWSAAIDTVKAFEHPRTHVARILAEQNGKFGSGEKSLANAEKLANGDCYAIVTGQQVGILTGPLYTVYKAITAIRLAETLSRRHGTGFVPVFWMASNDHDFNEVSHVNLFDGENNLHSFTYDPASPPDGRPMNRIQMDETFGNLIREIKNSIPAADFNSAVFELVEESYSTGAGISDGFARMMARLFGKYGLVLLDPSAPELLRLAAPVVEKEIRNPLKSTEHANNAVERLTLAGYKPQVEKSAARTALFLEDEDGIRRPLGYRDGRFVTAGANLSFSENELLELLNDKPGRFSPNVLLRSVVQDHLLPTAAYVAGPSEIAYFAQMKTVYEMFGVPQPIIFPRISMTLLAGQTAELLEDIGADAIDLAAGPQELFSRLVLEKLSDDVERLTAEPGRQIDDIMENLSETLAAFDAGLRDATEPVRRKIAHQIETLRRKILKVGRRKNQDLKHRIDKVYKRVFPGGAPQERVLNVTSFLAEYGFEFIDRLYEASDIFSDQHQVLNL